MFEYEIGEFGGTLTFATIAEPLTLNLALANDAGSSGVLGNLFEGLTEISWLTGEPQPNLAHTWDVSADGLTWTFYLRRDVRWHDGEPFTVADVEFTFNQIIYNEDIPTSTRATFNFRLAGRERRVAGRANDGGSDRRVHGAVRPAGLVCAVPALDGDGDLSAAHPATACRRGYVQ